MLLFDFWLAVNSIYNCKILHGGMLLQPCPDTSGMQQQYGENFAPISGKNQGFLLEQILRLNSSEDKKKVFTAIW